MRTTDLHRVSLCAAAVAVVIAALLPAAAPAGTGILGGCTISWAAAADGSWFDPASWDQSRVPTSTDDACIAQPGAYTVSVDGGGATVNSLTLGGTASSPTLRLVGTVLSDSNLTAADTVDVGSGATVELTSAGAPAAATLVAKSVVNGGTLAVRFADGGDRMLTSSLTNSGTVTLDKTLIFDGAGAIWLNQGATTIGDGRALSLPGGQTFTNAGGGALTEVGSGQLQLTDSTLNFGVGDFTGTTPIALNDSDLNVSTGAAATFLWHGPNGRISGNLSASQKLLVVALCSEGAQVNATASFTNAGTIELTANGCDGPGAGLSYAPKTLTNSGTITVSAGSGGTRSITGNLTNQGAVTVGRTLAFDGSASTWSNTGPLTIADGAAVALAGGQTFTNAAGGSVNTGNSGQLRLYGSTFNHGAGTLSWNHPHAIGSYPGTYPVLLDSSNLTVTSTNSASFLWHGVGGQLTGGLPGASQEIAIEGTCAAPARLDAASNFTNAGFIELAAAGCASDAGISMPGRTLTNQNLINVLSGAIGGARTIDGTLAQQKQIGLDEDVALQVTGNFVEGRKTTFRTVIHTDNDFGSIHVAGSATLDGTLARLAFDTYKPGIGATLPIVVAGSRTGTFTKVNFTSFGARYLLTTYNATGVTLLGGECSITLAPTTVPAGSSVTVTGAGFPANDTVKLTLKDAGGTQTLLGSPSADAGGAFSTSIVIPPSASPGKARISAKSTLTGAVVTKTLTVQ